MMNVNGVLLIDKPTGMTSHAVVREIRHILQMKAVGHAGTLDPLATGLLVILLGEATYLSSDLSNNDKSYHVKVKLGVETDTWDMDGRVVKENLTPLDTKWVVSEVRKLVGDLELPVPAFSAVKRGGRKLYEYARQNQKIEIPKRKMSFYNLVVGSVGEGFVEVDVSCSKGSFIRSWAYQLGVNLAAGACVEKLRRTASSPYQMAQGISLEKLKRDELRSPYFIPLSDCLSSYQALTISGRNEHLMTNGQIPHELSQRLIYNQKQVNRSAKPLPVRVMSGRDGQLLSILEVRPFQALRIKKIFKTNQRALL